MGSKAAATKALQPTGKIRAIKAVLAKTFKTIKAAASKAIKVVKIVATKIFRSNTDKTATFKI
jgi:hypothetical protein